MASTGEETSSSEDTSASSSSSWSSSKVDVPEGWSGSFELKGDVVFKPADFPTAYDATPAEREIAGMKLSVQAVATFDKGVSLQFRKEASNKTPGILYNVAALSKAISDIKIVSGGAGTGFVNVLMSKSLAERRQLLRDQVYEFLLHHAAEDENVECVRYVKRPDSASPKA